MATLESGSAQQQKSRPVIGRFAPSPSGPLHFGSLLAAVASYADARSRGGRWLLRIEDIDPPRCVPGARDRIVRTLERFGFEWDGPILSQIAADSAHRAAIEELQERGLAYPCGCSRRDLADVPSGPLGPVYPGTCRRGTAAAETAIRIRTHAEAIRIDDRVRPAIEQHLEPESGDFIIRRRDGLIAYHLAVVVDDAAQGVTDVVRGADLYDSTPRQVYLQRLLGLPTPAYAHIPLAIDRTGEKLGKSTGAKGLDDADPVATLLVALETLAHPPPLDLASASVSDVWSWTLDHWSTEALVGVPDIAVQHYCDD